MLNDHFRRNIEEARAASLAVFFPVQYYIFFFGAKKSLPGRKSVAKTKESLG